MYHSEAINSSFLRLWPILGNGLDFFPPTISDRHQIFLTFIAYSCFLGTRDFFSWGCPDQAINFSLFADTILWDVRLFSRWVSARQLTFVSRLIISWDMRLFSRLLCATRIVPLSINYSSKLTTFLCLFRSGNPLEPATFLSRLVSGRQLIPPSLNCFVECATFISRVPLYYTK